MKAVFLLDDKNYRRIYSNETIEKIESKVENLGRYDIDQLEDIDLSTVDFIFSGWKGAKIDRYLLEKMPNLKVVFYGAGSIKKIQTQEMWNRKIRITSASAINAIPVAQYTFSIIQLACKDFFRLTREIEKVRKDNIDVYDVVKGFYNRDIGIISYSKVAKKLIKYLNNFKNNIWLYDPYIKKEELRNLNIRKASLEDIFTNCDIISLHAPLIEDTRNMIRKEHFEMMKQNATFINTARGQIINQNDLLDVFKSRKDLLAVLDVTYPEPLPKDSELYKMKNVIISPHIAGSLGDEIQAMGELMYNELNNYLTAGNLEYEITEQQFKIMA